MSKSSPSQEQLNSVFELNQEYWNRLRDLGKKSSVLMDISFIKRRCKDPHGKQNSKFNRLDESKLVIDIGYPIAHRNENGELIGIQLREIKPREVELVIGCGNNPTSVCYHFPTHRDFVSICHESFPSINYAELIVDQCFNDLKSGNTHCHYGAVTINPEIEMNPTIIGHWAFEPMPFLPDNHFKHIEEEGITLTNLQYYWSERERLLIK